MTEGTLTLDQLRGELRPDIKKVVEDALAAWKPAEPAPPAGSVKAAQDFPRFLDVTIDGQKRKAELLDPKEGVYAAQTQMRQGIAGLVEAGDSLRILGVTVPLASVGLGFVGGMVVGNIIDVVVPPKDFKTDMTGAALNFAAHGAAVWGIMRYGPGLVGSTASKFAVGVIIFRVLLRVLPIQQWIDSLTGSLTGLLPSPTGMRQLAAGQAAQGYQALQPTSVQSETYARRI